MVKKKKKHARLSPSSAFRWFNCPGSASLVKKVPKQPRSSYAKEGTAAHELVEGCLLCDTDAIDLVGMKTSDGVEVTEDMAEHCQLFLDTVREDQRKYGGDILSEEHVDVHELHEDLDGTPDAALFSPKKKSLRVYDLKYGIGVVVGVHENAQLLIYLLGLIKKLGIATRVATVESIIVQPRRDFEDDEGEDARVRRHTMTIGELLEWRDKVLVGKINATDEKPVYYNPSEETCRWCDAAGICEALKERSLSVAAEVFQAPAVKNCEDLSNVEPEIFRLGLMASAMSTERLAEALNWIPLLEHWINVLRRHAAGRMTNGEQIPGYKLVNKYGNRRWKEDEKVILRVLRKFGNLTEPECWTQRKLISPAQAEKLMTVKEKKTIVKQLVEKPHRGVIMVPQSDKRPAINQRVEDVFGLID